MKRFSRIHRLDFYRDKDRQRSANVANWVKYSDDEHVNDLSPKVGANAKKLGRQPRLSSPPPSSFLRIHSESHQQFLNVVKHRRSRTPTPSPSAFDDLEHLQNRFHFRDHFRAADMKNDMKQRLK